MRNRSGGSVVHGHAAARGRRCGSASGPSTTVTCVTTDAPPVEGARPVCVLLDSNQWRRHYGLRSSLGAALLFYMRQNRATLALPEVVESEVVPLLAKEGSRAAKAIREELRIVQRVTGSSPIVDLPDMAALMLAVEKRMQELDPLISRVPVTLSHLRSALSRVNDARSPNRKKEQFKDSLIWEAASELAKAHQVMFVTEDQAFFSADRSSLALDLSEECASSGRTLRVFQGLAELLEELRQTAPALDYEAIAESLLAAQAEDLLEAASRDGLTPGDLTDFAVTAFATEDAETLALAYHLVGELLLEGSTSGNTIGRYELSGEARLDRESLDVRDLRPTQWRLIRTADPGEERVSTVVFAGAAVAYLGGEPPRPFTVRHQIGGTMQEI